jgi:hypothetical protein
MAVNGILIRIMAAKEISPNGSGNYPHKKISGGFFPDYAAIFRNWLGQYSVRAAN